MYVQGSKNYSLVLLANLIHHSETLEKNIILFWNFIETDEACISHWALWTETQDLNAIYMNVFWRALSSGMQHRLVRYKFTDIPKEHTAYISRVEN
jgi:hypothetical protein